MSIHGVKVDEYDDGLDVDSVHWTAEQHRQIVEDELREIGITMAELRAQAADGYFPDSRARFLWMIARDFD